MLGIDAEQLRTHLQRNSDAVHVELQRCSRAVEARVRRARERVLWHATRSRAAELSARMHNELLRRAQRIQRQRHDTVTALHSLARELVAGRRVADAAPSRALPRRADASTAAVHTIADNEDGDEDEEEEGDAVRLCGNVQAVLRCVAAAVSSEPTHYAMRVCPTRRQLHAFCVDVVCTHRLHRLLANAVGRDDDGHDDDMSSSSNSGSRATTCAAAPATRIDALVEHALTLLERAMSNNNDYDDDDDDDDDDNAASAYVRVPCFVSLAQYCCDVPPIAQHCDRAGASTSSAAAASSLSSAVAAGTTTAAMTTGDDAALGFLFAPPSRRASRAATRAAACATRKSSNNNNKSGLGKRVGATVQGDDDDNADDDNEDDEQDDIDVDHDDDDDVGDVHNRRESSSEHSDAHAVLVAVVQVVDRAWLSLQVPRTATLRPHASTDGATDAHTVDGDEDDGDDAVVVVVAGDGNAHGVRGALGAAAAATATAASTTQQQQQQQQQPPRIAEERVRVTVDDDDAEDDEALASLLDLVRIRYTIELAARLIALDTAKRALLEGEQGALFDGHRRVSLCCTPPPPRSRRVTTSGSAEAVTTPTSSSAPPPPSMCDVMEVAVLHLPHEEVLFYCVAYCIGAALLCDAQQATKATTTPINNSNSNSKSSSTQNVVRWAAALQQCYLTSSTHREDDRGGSYNDVDNITFAAAVRVWLYVCEYVLLVDGGDTAAVMTPSSSSSPSSSLPPAIVLPSAQVQRWLMAVAAAAASRGIAQSSLFCCRPRRRGAVADLSLPSCAASLRADGEARVYAQLVQHLRRAATVTATTSSA